MTAAPPKLQANALDYLDKAFRAHCQDHGLEDTPERRRLFEAGAAASARFAELYLTPFFQQAEPAGHPPMLGNRQFWLYAVILCGLTWGAAMAWWFK